MSNRSTLRYEAALKVTGSAVYEAEVPAADLLHAALVEASISCGDVLSVDATQAVDVPGFAAMVSYIDAEVLQASPATALIRERIIHFAGQPVALVTANTLQAAREAARTTKLTTQVRPAVTALEQALDKSFAPAMVGRFPAETHRGDGSRALAEADLVVRHRYETAVNNHHPMEPHAVVCWWEGGKAVVHTSTQAIFGTRAMIAHAFQMPASDIRVISRFLGGGFGCKGQLWWPWMFWAMLASRKTGRPVRLELTRAQMFTLVGRRQETVQDLGLGFSVDGRLTAPNTQTRPRFIRASCMPARMSRRRTVSYVPTSRNPSRCARRAQRRERSHSNPHSTKRPSGWGSTRSNFACATLPIMIRNRAARGAATACLSAIASVPNGSAGRSGRSRVPPPTDAGWSVGAWQARFIRQYAKPARSVSNWQ